MIPRNKPLASPIELGGRAQDTYWDDLRFPAVAINPVGQAAPPNIDTTDGTLLFSGGSINTIAIVAQMPHNWKEGTAISPHLHWGKATSAAGTVIWKMKYRWANIGDVFPGYSSLVTSTEVVLNANTSDKHSLAAFPNIQGIGKRLSSILLIYIERTGTEDTYAGAAKLFEFDIHYEIDSLGSDDEYTKH